MTMIKLAAAGFLAFGSAMFVAPLAVRAADATSTMKTADMDKDGTLDMAEAKMAAMSHFKAADADHEGTLDAKEAGMDVSSVDGDKDGTVDQAEYEKAVTKAFQGADADKDGTVDAKELASANGKTLETMIQ